jgi:hypothetical protein
MNSVKLFLKGYALVSLATVGAIVALRDHSSLVTSAVWVRGLIVLASSLIALALARRAANGSRTALRRLRIIAPIILIAIAVIVALPGAFPVWFRWEQALCGVLVAGVVVQINRASLRTAPAAA